MSNKNDGFLKRFSGLAGAWRRGIKQPVVEDDLPVYDVTPFAAEIDLDAFEVIRSAPVWMSRAERLLLFTLVFTLRPRRYLEIGTFQGGSALLTAAAMSASGSDGQMVCVEPDPHVEPEDWAKIENRTTLLEGFSPDVLPAAVEVAGEPFDFVLIDGDHSYEGVLRDARGVLPFVADGAYLLFHDSFFIDVARGINEFVEQNRDILVDFGTLTREITVQEREDDTSLRWGGLRLMQVRRR